ncbi:DUF1905 domain-containing protein [Nocardioides seonyuensis]|uniref:DUF1905 domain-containing protein n=1 Tax=Nocardioides seonyuensis TaxID=2518371 RepID=A0A4P7ILW6_9ACTN|nr:DUF1905 domain-containing protein [Nocardioides seonyuensis]QBX57191.1 DUF1905 domain-containing protein [Nocardioides seonyuensis]
MDECRFTGDLFRWDAQEAWFFVTLTEEATAAVREHPVPPRGFGSVKVEVTLTSEAGETTWRTSVFPDKQSGRFLLPVKAAVRKAHDVDEGDSLDLALVVLA